MQFRLFGIPIRVNPFFLLIAAYIGYVTAENTPTVDVTTGLLVSIPMVFVAVLAHELGHAFAGMAFQLRPRIELHGFGGLTSWTEGRALSPGRSILVSFAGPLVGILLGIPALIWLLGGGPGEPVADFALSMFVFVNLGWGVLNLIPMLPLDGGNIMASFFELLSPGKGRLAARYISLGIAALVLAWALFTLNVWVLVLVGFMAWSNFQALRAERQIGEDMPLVDEVRQVQGALEKGDVATVVRRAEELLGRARTPLVRTELVNMLGWGRYLSGDSLGARRALETPGHRPDPALYGIVLLDGGQPEAAVAPLEAALRRGGQPLVDEKLAEAFIRSERWEQAAALYGSRDGHHASVESIEAVRDAARRAGAPEADDLDHIAERRRA